MRRNVARGLLRPSSISYFCWNGVYQHRYWDRQCGGGCCDVANQQCIPGAVAQANATCPQPGGDITVLACGACMPGSNCTPDGMQ